MLRTYICCKFVQYDNEAAAYTWKGNKMNININNYSDENGNCVPVQPNDKEDLDNIESQVRTI